MDYPEQRETQNAECTVWKTKRKLVSVFPHRPAFLSSCQVLLRKAAGMLWWWRKTRSGPEHTEGLCLSVSRRQAGAGSSMCLGWGDSMGSSAGLGAEGEWERGCPCSGSSSGQTPMELQLLPRSSKLLTEVFLRWGKNPKRQKEKPKKKSPCLSKN